MGHRITLPQALLDVIAARRGAPHVFMKINPARTAHLVIDLQEGFLAPGAPAEVPAARDILPAVNRISAAMRQAGGVNIFTRFITDAAALASWTVNYDQLSNTGLRELWRQTFTPGSPDFELSAQLDVGPTDLVVDKSRLSALVPGTCSLPEILETRGIRTLIISGTMTNACCESTARDAMQRNYEVIFVSDATATMSDAEHNATLANIATFFGDVMTAQEVVAALARHGVA
jgi:ureidoacrylate peracid hydrolase